MIKEEIILGTISNVRIFVEALDQKNDFITVTAAINAYDKPVTGQLWVKAIYKGEVVGILSLTPRKHSENSINLDVLIMNSRYENKYVDTEIIDELRYLLDARNLTLTSSV